MNFQKLILLPIIFLACAQNAMEKETKKIVCTSYAQLNPTLPYIGPESTTAFAASFINKCSMLASVNSTTSGNYIQLWQGQEPYNCVAEAKNPAPYRSNTIARNAVDYLATPCGNDIIVWDTATLKQTAILKGHTDLVNAINFNPIDSAQCISGSQDQTAKIWDMRSKNCINTISDNGIVNSINYSTDAANIALTNNASHIGKIWDLAANKLLYQIVAQTMIMYNAQNTQLAAGLGPVISVYKAQANELLEQIKSNGKWLTGKDPDIKNLANGMALDFSPEGSRLAIATDSNYLALADPTANNNPYCFDAGVVLTNSCQFNNDGTQLLTASTDTNDDGSTIRIWELNRIEESVKKTKSSRYCSLQ